MLRRVENVQVFYRRDAVGLLRGQYKILLQVGRKEHLSARRVTPDEFKAMAMESRQQPVAYLRLGDRTYWRYQDRWFSDSEDLDQASVRALLDSRALRQAERVSRAKTVSVLTQAPVPAKRGKLPADLKQLVWTRDGGTCQACGSNKELQFDHIIPVAYGGATSEENLQVLCGPCNRRKGASIA